MELSAFMQLLVRIEIVTWLASEVKRPMVTELPGSESSDSTTSVAC
jgi:hypothetical protein